MSVLPIFDSQLVENDDACARNDNGPEERETERLEEPYPVLAEVELESFMLISALEVQFIVNRVWQIVHHRSEEARIKIAMRNTV